MSRWSLCTALLLPVAGTAAQAGDTVHTMNFSNVTSSHVTQNTAEAPQNEKDVEVGDFDEDGDLDVVIANAFSDFGARQNKVYENVDGTFMEVTNSGIIPGFGPDKVSRNAFLRDFTGDGHLDIWIINDSNSNNDQVFVANWADGQFQSWTEENTRILGGAMTGAACSGYSADFDQDLDFDVYCGNYPNDAQDRLYLNDGSGLFSNVTATHVPVRNDYVVDIHGSDMNGDGKLDILVSNFGANQNYIYYNDNLGAGSGVGDFRYTGSEQALGNPSANENAMTGVDLDGDGDQDVYWSNAVGTSEDRILRNDGNDAGNKAVFTNLDILPGSVQAITSRKSRAADFNGDGRLDMLVMKEGGSNSRPTVLRNVTLPGGAIELIDWTPGTAFPTGGAHKGWDANLFDSDNDGDTDIFIGGWTNDHLIENVPSVGWTEDGLTDGIVPNLFGRGGNAVEGTTGPGQSDTYQVLNAVITPGFISVVVTGPDDYQVEILDAGDNVLATIDRGGVGVEEAGQYDWAIAPGTVKVRVTGIECGSAYDVGGDCNVDTVDFLELLAAWGSNPGHPADFNDDDVVDTVDFLDLLGNWNADVTYTVEVLSRGL